MPGFRINLPDLFWFEDLAYSAIEEARRLPERTRAAWRWLAARTPTAPTLDEVMAKLRPARPIELAPSGPAEAIVLAPLLDEPEAWALATEPLSTADAATAKANALHAAAAEQLDALTYALDRLRQEIRPLMTYARFADEPVHTLPANALETSIEALLELSRVNEATRPKDRMRIVA